MSTSVIDSVIEFIENLCSQSDETSMSNTQRESKRKLQARDFSHTKPSKKCKKQHLNKQNDTFS